jgi:DNA-binding CsgD family transcriptional regulator
MATSLVLVSLSLFSGFFTLGAAVFLFIQHRTAILRVVVLFIASLVLISGGSWLQLLGTVAGGGAVDVGAAEAGLAEAGAEDTEGAGGGVAEALDVIIAIIALCGLVLNVAVVPYLVAALVSRSIEGPLTVVLWVWDGILIVAGLLYPFVQNPDPLTTVMNVQLVLTITVGLSVVAVGLRTIPNADFRRSALIFLIISAVFLVFLVADILISRLAIDALGFMDNMSLPFYIFALNVGSFFFAGRFLNTDPLLREGRVTDACRERFGLTAREAEIIEELLDGKTNQKLADTLFISRKTVENHLYNIFQKMDVKNRVQLIGTLRNWNHVEPQ